MNIHPGSRHPRHPLRPAAPLSAEEQSALTQAFFYAMRSGLIQDCERHGVEPSAEAGLGLKVEVQGKTLSLLESEQLPMWPHATPIMVMSPPQAQAHLGRLSALFPRLVQFFLNHTQGIEARYHTATQQLLYVRGDGIALLLRQQH